VTKLLKVTFKHLTVLNLVIIIDVHMNDDSNSLWREILLFNPTQ